MRVTALVAASVGLAALSACSDSTQPLTDPTPPLSAAVQVQPGWMNAHVHVMPTRAQAAIDFNAAHGARPGGGGGGGHHSTSNGIDYHGGPVLHSGTKVVAVYWAGSTIYNGGPAPGATGSASQDGSLIGYFLSHLGGSPYFGINSTYTDGSGGSIANSVTYSGFWANNTNAPSGSQSVSDGQMIAMLQSGFDSGKLSYDASTLYAIFTAGKVNLGGGFGSQYCAYHGWATVSVNGQSKTVLYAAMPYDYAYPSSCSVLGSAGSANNDYGADAEVNTLAHETEETTTDMNGNAWYDRRGYENADKCAWTFGTTYTSNGATANMRLGTKDFLVQQNWVNASGGYCALSS